MVLDAGDVCALAVYVFEDDGEGVYTLVVAGGKDVFVVVAELFTADGADNVVSAWFWFFYVFKVFLFFGALF